MPAILTKTKEEINNGPLDTLPETKIKNGYLYKLVKRNKKAAMYSQEFVKTEKGIKKGIIGYEVFKIAKSKPLTFLQKSGTKSGMWYQYPETERFPCNEDFGNHAFAIISLEKAEEKYQELSN